MFDPVLLLAGLFLPLFPLSMITTSVLALVRPAWARAILMLAWPQAGVVILGRLDSDVPDWVVAWAMMTALFYGWRALAMRDGDGWLAFMAVSSWAVLWGGGQPGQGGHVLALGLGLGLAAMALVLGQVAHRFGAAHAALDLRMAASAPRLSGVLAATALAVIAMPLSPGFFALLLLITRQAPNSVPTVLAILGIWFLWTWSGLHLVQHLVSGARRKPVPNDISRGAAWGWALFLATLAAAGLAMGVTFL